MHTIRSFLRRVGLAPTLDEISACVGNVAMAAIRPRIDEWAAAATIVDERIGQKAR